MVALVTWIALGRFIYLFSSLAGGSKLIHFQLSPRRQGFQLASFKSIPGYCGLELLNRTLQVFGKCVCVFPLCGKFPFCYYPSISFSTPLQLSVLVAFKTMHLPFCLQNFVGLQSSWPRHCQKRKPLQRKNVPRVGINSTLIRLPNSSTEQCCGVFVVFNVENPFSL